MSNKSTTKRPPPSTANKVKRAIWLVFYLLLFRFSPTPLHFWRRALLRLFGASIGRKVLVYSSVKVWAPWNLTLADFATVGSGVNLYSVDKIVIGHSAIVSQGVHLCTASHDFNSGGFELITAEIRILDNAWVAAEAFVGPGVSIGEHAVVGARSVVTKSVDPKAVVAGNPARLIHERSEEGRNVLANQTRA